VKQKKFFSHQFL